MAALTRITSEFISKLTTSLRSMWLRYANPLTTQRSFATQQQNSDDVLGEWIEVRRFYHEDLGKMAGLSEFEIKDLMNSKSKLKYTQKGNKDYNVEETFEGDPMVNKYNCTVSAWRYYQRRNPFFKNQFTCQGYFTTNGIIEICRGRHPKTGGNLHFITQRQVQNNGEILSDKVAIMSSVDMYVVYRKR